MEDTSRQSQISSYVQALREQERSPATIQKYSRIVSQFLLWLDGATITKEVMIAWKAELQEHCAASTVNAKLSAVNGFLRHIGLESCRVRPLTIQRRTFSSTSQAMEKEEYRTLVQTAVHTGRIRLALILETIGSTGIRVSELRFITVESLETGRAQISLKGKIRTILLPDALRVKLLRYAREQGISSGEIFRTRTGRGISRGQIWAEMKSLCQAAGVDPRKTFPHNLRHLFAVTFYRSFPDISTLADLLGHSSIQTTRIYLVSPGEEHLRLLNCLDLVLPEDFSGPSGSTPPAPAQQKPQGESPWPETLKVPVPDTPNLPAKETPACHSP